MNLAQRSFLVDVGLRPDADDNLAETFSRTLTDHELAEFERIGAESEIVIPDTAGASGGTGDTVTRGAGDGDTGDGDGGQTGSPPIQRGTDPPSGPGAAEIDVEERIRRGIEQNEQRRRERLEFIRQEAGDDVPRDLVERAMAECWPQDRTSREFLRAIRTRPPAAASGGHVGIHSRSHETSCTLEALQGGLLLREGFALDSQMFSRREAESMLRRQEVGGQWLHTIARGGDGASTGQTSTFLRARDEAHRYSSMSLVDFCREALRLAGRQIPDDRDDMIHRAVSTAALASIFSTSINMQVLQAYLGIADSTRGWVFEEDCSNFMLQERSRLTKASGMTKLPRGAEAEQIQYSDAVEAYKIARYAGHFNLDDQDIIDDRFGGTTGHTPMELGELAAELRPNLVYAIMLANANMRDSVALFHANHGNLSTTAALAAATLATAKANMAKQTENGRSIQTAMRYLIVPENLEFIARQLVTSAELRQADGGATTGTANPHQGRFQVVSDPRLDNGVTDPDSGVTHAGSGTTWYGAAAAGRTTIEVGYRRGTGRAPRMDTYTLTGARWGMGWKCNMDIGAKAIDWRGLHKATA